MLFLLLTLSCFGVFLNILFIVVSRLRSDITPSTHIFLYNLAAGNIMTCTFCFSWDLTVGLGYESSVWQCVLQYFCIQITLFVTLGTVTVMCVERYVAISKPFSYKLIFTTAKRRLMLCGIWTIAVVFSILTIEDFVSGISNGICTPLNLYPRRYAVHVIGCILFVYQLSQLSANSALIYILLKSKVDSKRASRAHKATSITLACSVSYTITVTPLAAFLIHMGVSDEDPEVLIVQPFSIAANGILVIITVVDPAIYFLSLCLCDSFKRSRVSHINEAPPSDNPQNAGDNTRTESIGANPS